MNSLVFGEIIKMALLPTGGKEFIGHLLKGKPRRAGHIADRQEAILGEQGRLRDEIAGAPGRFKEQSDALKGDLDAKREAWRETVLQNPGKNPASHPEHAAWQDASQSYRDANLGEAYASAQKGRKERLANITDESLDLDLEQNAARRRGGQAEQIGGIGLGVAGLAGAGALGRKAWQARKARQASSAFNRNMAIGAGGLGVAGVGGAAYNRRSQ